MAEAIKERERALREQPYLATLGLIAVAVAGVAAIAVVRVLTQDVPAGLVAITTTAVTGLAMSAGRRRT